jgi:hypothetical protein
MKMTSRIASDSQTERALIGVRFCFCARRKKESRRARRVAIPTSLLRRAMHDAHTSNELEMVSSGWMEDLAMTRSIVDTTFPSVLVCSTFGAIVSLASVWLVTALTDAPVVVA